MYQNKYSNSTLRNKKYSSIHLFNYLFIHFVIHISIYLASHLYLSSYLYSYLSSYLSFYLSFYLHSYLSSYLSFYISSYLSFYLSSYLTSYLSFYICLYQLTDYLPKNLVHSVRTSNYMKIKSTKIILVHPKCKNFYIEVFSIDINIVIALFYIQQ